MDRNMKDEMMCDFSAMDQDELFRTRLFIEGNIECPDIYSLMSGELDGMKDDLKRAERASGSGYEEWKEKYINEQLKALERESLLAGEYHFGGMGSAKEIFTAEEKGLFEEWIQGNGSAVISDIRNATSDEVKIYIAKNALR